VTQDGHVERAAIAIAAGHEVVLAAALLDPGHRALFGAELGPYFLCMALEAANNIKVVEVLLQAGATVNENAVLLAAEHTSSLAFVNVVMRHLYKPWGASMDVNDLEAALQSVALTVHKLFSLAGAPTTPLNTSTLIPRVLIPLFPHSSGTKRAADGISSGAT
jgi:hypothetical protein